MEHLMIISSILPYAICLAVLFFHKEYVELCNILFVNWRKQPKQNEQKLDDASLTPSLGVEDESDSASTSSSSQRNQNEQMQKRELEPNQEALCNNSISTTVPIVKKDTKEFKKDEQSVSDNYAAIESNEYIGKEIEDKEWLQFADDSDCDTVDVVDMLKVFRLFHDSVDSGNESYESTQKTIKLAPKLDKVLRRVSQNLTRNGSCKRLDDLNQSKHSESDSRPRWNKQSSTRTLQKSSSSRNVFSEESNQSNSRGERKGRLQRTNSMRMTQKQKDNDLLSGSTHSVKSIEFNDSVRSMAGDTSSSVHYSRPDDSDFDLDQSINSSDSRPTGRRQDGCRTLQKGHSSRNSFSEESNQFNNRSERRGRLQRTNSMRIPQKQKDNDFLSGSNHSAKSIDFHQILGSNRSSQSTRPTVQRHSSSDAYESRNLSRNRLNSFASNSSSIHLSRPKFQRNASSDSLQSRRGSVISITSSSGSKHATPIAPQNGIDGRLGR
jgi:hypothetical protein